MNQAQAAIKILTHPLFDPKEFSSRWEKARLAALRSILGSSEDEGVTENQLLLRLGSEDRETVLRRVFDHSRKFGMSASRYFGMSFEVSDLAELMQALEVPCFRGQWRMNHSAYVLERKGCESLETLGSLGCDYWREAFDGLVVGVGENERLARHRSCGHGDAECVDVLFEEQHTPPRVVTSESEVPAPRKYGPVPLEVVGALDSVRERFQKMKIRLLLDGLSEGVLYYRLETADGVLCGSLGKILHDSFDRDLARLFPQFKAQDAAPLAVYGGAT